MKKKLFSRFYGNRDGATIIEFAIIAPMLFLMIMGIIEFALIMYASSVVENATAAGSRFGITGSSYSGDDRSAYIKGSIQRLSAGMLNEDNVVIKRTIYNNFGGVSSSTANPQDGAFGCANQAVLYDVSYNWNLFTPMIAYFFDDGKFVIKSSTLVKNENFAKDNVAGCP